MQGWTTLIKVAGIVLMSVLFLLRATGSAETPHATPVPGGSLVAGFGLAMIATLWAYEGWQFVTYSAGEAQEPQRTFPRAIVLGTAALVAHLPARLPRLYRGARSGRRRGIEPGGGRGRDRALFGPPRGS